MANTKKIMVAYDLSDCAFEALTYAVQLSLSLKAKLLVVNVINQRDADAILNAMKKITAVRDDFYLSPEEYLQGLKEDRRTEIEQALEKVKCEDLSTRIVLRVGVPFEQLIGAAGKHQADIVVMGNKGRTNLADILVGSTAEKMFRHCPTPILSIRKNDREDNGPAKTVQKILVAVDFSDYSLAAVQYAATLAADIGAGLLLVNVINNREASMIEKVANRFPQFSAKKHLKETREARGKSFQEYINASDCSQIVVDTSIRVGTPYEELLKEIHEKKADLFVMANKGRSNLVDTVIGSCAQKMFRRSPVPVLSFRGQPEG